MALPGMPVGVNPGGESISVGEDIIRYIYDEHVGIYELSAENITNLLRVSPLFYQIFRPYTYRHVNLRRPSDAIAFFSIVATPAYVVLAAAVQSLQLSFNLDKKTYEGPGPEVQAYLGLWDFEDMTTSTWGVFWTHFRAGMPRLSFLSALSISFSHDDNNVLGRLIKENKGNLRNSLPPSVRKLHLKPVPEEYGNVDLELCGEGPWDNTLWRLHLAQIPYIEELFITSPMYIVWPPTQSVVNDDIKQWTAQLRCSNVATSSTLQRIILNCGFGDEGGSVEEWDESVEGAPVADVFEDSKSDGHHFVCQLVWERNAGSKSWKERKVYSPSHSLREEYLFGDSGREFLLPWIHIDLAYATKEWREWQQSQSRFMGNGTVY
ncbi:hypothetical protein C8R43DRAFT_954989 [Mycena crocata]|nr:hypothetical protein C8R43DRAFT_954989 [Mycena crocata]